MAGHTNFRKIREQRQRSSGSEERVAEIRRAYRDILRLANLRNAMGVTQTELASQMDVSQANVSRVEHGEDLYLSTLADYITALGGTLRVQAEFPEGVYPLMGKPPPGDDHTYEPAAILQQKAPLSSRVGAESRESSG